MIAGWRRLTTRRHQWVGIRQETSSREHPASGQRSPYRRVTRPGAELFDAHGGQTLLEVHGLMTVAGDELDAVVTDQLARRAVFGYGGFHGPPGCGCGEPSGSGGADGEAGVVVEDVDHPRADPSARVTWVPSICHKSLGA